MFCCVRVLYFVFLAEAALAHGAAQDPFTRAGDAARQHHADNGHPGAFFNAGAIHFARAPRYARTRRILPVQRAAVLLAGASAL